MRLAAALLALIVGASPLPAQEPEGSGESAVALRIRSLEAELDRLADERDTVVRAFEAADVELALRREQLRIVADRAGYLEIEIAEQERRVTELTASVGRTREQLRMRALSLYRVGPLSYNRLLLAADSGADALVAYQLITFLTARDRDLVASAREELDALDEARANLDVTRAELGRLQEEVVARTEILEAGQEARRQALRSLDVETETRRVALAEAERAANELESTIGSLRVEGAAEDVAIFAAARGNLPWPVPGEVVGGFGRRKHPIYDTYTVSRGIEIAGEIGDPVAAVHAGRVVFADWYSGYGLLVIVDHGGDFFTLYGHLSAIEVRNNERVQPGQLIGRVGETASLSGPNLYFELREGTDALNPTQWLAPR